MLRLPQCSNHKDAPGIFLQTNLKVNDTNVIKLITLQAAQKWFRILPQNHSLQFKSWTHCVIYKCIFGLSSEKNMPTLIYMDYLQKSFLLWKHICLGTCQWQQWPHLLMSSSHTHLNVWSETVHATLSKRSLLYKTRISFGDNVISPWQNDTHNMPIVRFHYKKKTVVPITTLYKRKQFKKRIDRHIFS